MSKKPKNELVIRNSSQFEQYVKNWVRHDFQTDPRTIINKRYIRRKTFSQNSTIYGLIRRLCEHTGDDFDYLKSMFKRQFGPYVETLVPWDKEHRVNITKSIADYDIEEASNMIEKILYIASDHYGVYLEIEDK